MSRGTESNEEDITAALWSLAGIRSLAQQEPELNRAPIETLNAVEAIIREEKDSLAQRERNRKQGSSVCNYPPGYPRPPQGPRSA